MRIEMLFPDVANLHGDNFNVTYLSQCRPDSKVIRTLLNDTPAFVTTAVDLIYLGPMSERSQRWVIERLWRHRGRIAELIENGTTFLFTHNAMEVLGERIIDVTSGRDTTALGIFPFTTSVDTGARINSKVIGDVAGARVVGYKSQFSSIWETAALPCFLEASRGLGRNRETCLEGVHVNNFFGTSLLGPLLIMNPLFTKELLKLMDSNVAPTLAYEKESMAAYQARLTDFADTSRWHPREKVTGER
ncbi:MAG: hypothetical protein LBJ43_05530 [Propionibacteriaceae bacterium]|jgi:CobQ-like glutamine amidotransferase family enzyme|nr:hypothetical protein [Propionibacteriaceae bacterium]